MIRMGRGSKTEQPDAMDYQGHTSTSAAYQYGNESTQAAPRVVTDSESIARDIKEGRLSGFVGHGTSLSGDMNFQMMLRVDGHLTGTVSSEGGTLIVGTNGQVDANISVSVATINGTVNGDIIAAEKIHLGRTARVVGNIATPRFVIEEGAIFEGGCNMLKAREMQEKQTTEATASQYTTSSQYPTYQDTTAEDDDADESVEASADEDEKVEAAVL